MPLVALTGGIASGKSTIAARLRHHGAIIVDADAIVREVQLPGTPVLAAIAAQFGAAMVLPDGSLDRAALGSRVFGDPEAVQRLNAIVHPAVRVRSQQLIEQAQATAADAVVVYDVPLLVEARGDGAWDLIVVAHAPAEVRARRLIELRGFAPQDAQARLRSQTDDAARLAIADVVVDTAGSLEQTRLQVDDLWSNLGSLVAERARGR